MNITSNRSKVYDDGRKLSDPSFVNARIFVALRNTGEYEEKIVPLLSDTPLNPDSLRVNINFDLVDLCILSGAIEKYIENDLKDAEYPVIDTDKISIANIKRKNFLTPGVTKIWLDSIKNELDLEVWRLTDGKIKADINSYSSTRLVGFHSRRNLLARLFEEEDGA